MISFGAGIGGGLSIGKSLGVQGPSKAAWIPASYSSVTHLVFHLLPSNVSMIPGLLKALSF